MGEDYSRVINGSNLGLDHTNIPHLEALSRVVSKCQEDSSCLELQFDGQLSLTVNSVPIYRAIDQWFRSSAEPEKRRRGISIFNNRLKRDLEDHRFRPNSALKVVKNEATSELRLALDGEAFNDEEKGIIENFVQSIWKSEIAKVTLDWGSASAVRDLFKVLFHPNELGKRANVNYSNRTLNLYPGTRTRSIAHEFGHVLGFDDHYYTVWNPTDCAYVYEQNDHDLMSNSMSGEVTAEEWETLLGSQTEVPISRAESP